MGLGDRLKKLRGNRTQDDISKKIGVSRARYSHYENGRSEPDTETLQKLADFFEVSVDYLLGRTDQLFNVSEDGLESEIESLINDPETGIFFKGYLDAPEEKKKQMRDFMKFLLHEEKDRKPGDKQGK
jgi:transcriptional regulator with XRE-family HTH domain